MRRHIRKIERRSPTKGGAQSLAAFKICGDSRKTWNRTSMDPGTDSTTCFLNAAGRKSKNITLDVTPASRSIVSTQDKPGSKTRLRAASLRRARRLIHRKDLWPTTPNLCPPTTSTSAWRPANRAPRARPAHLRISPHAPRQRKCVRAGARTVNEARLLRVSLPFAPFSCPNWPSCQPRGRIQWIL
jgi:hypothetical protein